MSRLGDFLEAVYGPTDRFRTVRATIAQWQDGDLAAEALTASLSARGRRKSGASGPPVGVIETQLHFWMDGPERVRLEMTRRRNSGTESRLGVVNGARWWERDNQGHVEAGDRGTDRRSGGPSLTDSGCHFFPDRLREYLVPLALEAVGEARTADRECVRVRAVPRPDQLLWPHWLPPGADEYELHADPERGVLLFIAGRFRDQVFETRAVREVTFDEPLGEELFTYTPRPGEQVRPPDPIVEHMSLATAVARMPFAVLVPTRVPDEYEGHREVMYHPPRVGVDMVPYLMLMYHGPDGLWIRQTEAPWPREDYEWTAVEHGGRRMEISDPDADDGTRLIRLEHRGTHVEVTTSLSRGAALDLAASLEPVAKLEAGG